MADELTIVIDAEDVLALLEQLGPAAEAIVHDASRITAERIQQEARSRARRATGKLIEAITVEEAGPPMHGYRVFVGEMSDTRGPRADEFALWHEAGTKHMKAQPFMEVSAQLEEGRHLERLADALQAAIDEVNT